ncbi:GDSL-like Lipase/Acylhydrolase family [Bifidobacterium pseudolongum subsp. globosum]|uniref:GDSL-like Lipase/Acylhydrolase family n=1 Tax=Bifidobacterium pseudolongum subsp. globosum TaxID=1690 RepID=A0A4Q5A214_9BIFI|nr:SGNH/GDSL hydrolase family protein [Bifidobacterium pseudolongum]RYQ10424.1 GDSL-like Lipase/Acylhydrolase family [Bifidobacterium pseudolongum subsp. globosum]
MTDQIIDLQEATMPGPRGYQGPRGEQGLPGVNAVSNDEAIAAAIDSDASATWQALTRRGGERIIMLGDSWTAYYGGYLPQVLQQELGAQWIKNYGVSGNQLTHMANAQITRALADPTAKHPTAIVIVGGTNNIFNGTQTRRDIIDQTEDLCAKVKAAWPGVPAHLFPNMPRTPNQGFNFMYAELIERATNAGVSVHPESMWLPMYRDFMFYRTDADARENLQHLTKAGYVYFAGIIAAALRGGSEYLKAGSVCYADLQRYGQDDFPESTALTSSELVIPTAGDRRLIFEIGPGLVTLHFDCKSIRWARDIDPSVGSPTAADRHATLRLCTIPERGPENTTYDSSKKYLPFPPTRTIFAQACAYASRKPVYQGSVQIYPNRYGCTTMDVHLDKGDTTTPWASFSQVAFTASYPLSLDAI